MKKLEKEYRKVKAALDPIRERAQAAEDVRKAARSFRRSLNEKMVELEPQARAWMRRTRALAEKIESESREELGPGVSDPVVEEFEGLRSKLEAVRTRAREDETISDEWQSVRRRILDRMRELDPRVPALVAERNRIVREMKRDRRS